MRTFIYYFVLFSLVIILLSCRKRDVNKYDQEPTFIGKTYVYDYKDATNSNPNSVQISYDNATPRESKSIHYISISDNSNPLVLSGLAEYMPREILVQNSGIYDHTYFSNILSGNSYFSLLFPFDFSSITLNNYTIKRHNNIIMFNVNIIAKDTTIAVPYGNVKVNAVYIDAVEERYKSLFYYNRELGFVKIIGNYNLATKNGQFEISLSSAK